METGKNDWVNQVIASGEEVQRMQAPGHLYTSILRRLGETEREPPVTSAGHFRIALVAASLLALLNIGVLFLAGRPGGDRAPSAYAVDSHHLNVYSNE